MISLKPLYGRCGCVRKLNCKAISADASCRRMNLRASACPWLVYIY